MWFFWSIKMTDKLSGWGWVSHWNTIIYPRGDDGRHIEYTDKITNDELWEKFGIKSWPKFKDACASHVPPTWSGEIRELLTKAQDELGDRISYAQIKEKWCRLTIYYKSNDDEAQARMRELISECREELIEKGVHPPNEEQEDD